MRIDLHTHSSVSDGTDLPAQLVRAAAEAGLDVVGLCDHDTFDGLDEAVAAGVRFGVVVMPGLEMSTERLGESVHVLGLGARVDEPALLDELALVRRGRDGRLGAICEQLTAAGLPLSEQEVRAVAAHTPSVGRPHVADAMIAKGYVADRQEAFDYWLAEGKPGFVDRYATGVERAIELIQAAGGAAVIAHPWGRGRASLLPPEYLIDLANRCHLDGIEVDHNDHDQDATNRLRTVAHQAGLIVTGGSDYHGLGKKDHELGCHTTSLESYQALLELIAERGGRLPTEAG